MDLKIFFVLINKLKETLICEKIEQIKKFKLTCQITFISTHVEIFFF